PYGYPFCVWDGEAVDDPGAGESRDDGSEPRQALRAVGEVGHLQDEALSVERTPDDHEVIAELMGDVLDDAIVRGGSGAQDGHGSGEEVKDTDQPPVVRTEVVAPVADAVGLVNNE